MLIGNKTVIAVRLWSGGLRPAIACRAALAVRPEEFQQAIGDGPGLTAMRTERVAAVEDTAEWRRWATFEARAAAEESGRRCRCH